MWKSIQKFISTWFKYEQNAFFLQKSDLIFENFLWWIQNKKQAFFLSIFKINIDKIFLNICSILITSFFVIFWW